MCYHDGHAAIRLRALIIIGGRGEGSTGGMVVVAARCSPDSVPSLMMPLTPNVIRVARDSGEKNRIIGHKSKNRSSKQPHFRSWTCKKK